MELKYYLDKAIEEYLGKMGTITTKKIMNYVYSEYNLDVSAEEISKIIKAKTSILEIVDGIFVDKDSFVSFVKEIDTHLLKSQIEFQYFVSINDEQMVRILDIINLYKNEKSFIEEVAPHTEKKVEKNDLDVIKNVYETKDYSIIEGNQVKESNQVKEKDKMKWTYVKILNFGMDHGYINSSWVQDINYNLESEVQDYFEAIEEIQEKGIQINYL